MRTIRLLVPNLMADETHRPVHLKTMTQKITPTHKNLHLVWPSTTNTRRTHSVDSIHFYWYLLTLPHFSYHVGCLNGLGAQDFNKKKDTAK
jgi:hypothetical protein